MNELSTATAIGMGCLFILIWLTKSQICVVSPTNKKYIEWLTDKNGLNSNLHSDPTSLPKIHGTIMCLYQVSPGNDPWKWVIKLEKTGRYPNRQRFLVKESHPSPARTSTTASSTTTVLPDPPIPCLAPGTQRPRPWMVAVANLLVT